MVVHLDPNRSQGPLDLLLHEATDIGCFCVLEAKWTRSMCFSDGELGHGDNATNLGAAGSS